MPVPSSTSVTKPTGARQLRKLLHSALPLLGMAIILSVAVYRQELRDAAFIVLGVCLVEVGIWRLANKLLPDQRKYHALRAQADQFLNLVRHLNTLALRAKEDDSPQNRQAIAAVQQKMHRLVDGMTSVMGKTDAELAAQQQSKDMIGAAV